MGSHRLAALSGLLALLATAGPTSAGRAASSASSADWTVYHHDPAGSGAVPLSVDLAHLEPAWTSAPLDGELYGEPLVFSSRVYVATEGDSLYALSAATGRIVWRRHLGAPVPAVDLPCGDISPAVGITSTPVIDVARGEILAVADELVGGAPRHELYGLALSNGRIELHEAVDPPGADTAAILQRASLTLDGSRVVFGYGGNYGDCSTYHGWVVSVPVTGGPPTFFEVDARRSEEKGAIWMGGAAPVVGAHGDVYVAAGNGSVVTPGHAYDDSDSVLELSPALALVHLFAPPDWYRDNAADADLGSAAPAVLPNGLVVQAGKSSAIYLLKASLGGVGGQLAELEGACAGVFAGGVAFSGSTVYLPCESGVVALRTDAAHPRVALRWRAPAGAGGPPILAGGVVWTIGGATVFGLSPRTGRVVERLALGTSAMHFATPSFGDGRLLAPSAFQVHAFVERRPA